MISSSGGSNTIRARPASPSSRNTQDVGSFTGRYQNQTRGQRADSSASKPAHQGPRFFRLSPLAPYLSARVYYLRNAVLSSLLLEGKAGVQEIPKRHIASLVMSSGLLGMAGVRFPINMKREGSKGLVEFTLEEDDE